MSTPSGPDRITIEFSRAELLLVHNALNEVGNGLDIGDWEFPTRLGGSRGEARALLRRTGALLGDESGRPTPTPPG